MLSIWDLHMEGNKAYLPGLVQGTFEQALRGR